MSHLPRLVVVASMVAVASVPAQSHRPAPDPAVVVDSGCGLQHQDGVLWGLGRGYKARFAADGVEFTPALGAGAPRNLPLRFTFTAAGRDETQPGQPATRAPRQSVEGLSVRYHRDACIETYAVRPEGIEQSFVFHQLPAGSGDLWVRGRIDTPLHPSTLAWTEQLGFLASPQDGGVGGVHIGAITGVDAAGKVATGSMRYQDGDLVLRLPAAFVEGASMPLVLDPLIGTRQVVVSGFDDDAPDVTLLGSAHLVVWQRRFSSANVDIRAQRLGLDDLQPIGGLIAIRTSSAYSQLAKVAQVGSWAVVAWREGLGNNPSYIAACSVSTTGTVSAALQVTTGSDVFRDVDVAGDRSQSANEAIVVYANSSRGSVEGTRVTVASNGTLSRSSPTTLGTGVTPSISRYSGSGLQLVVWERNTGKGNRWVEGKVIDRAMSARFFIELTPRGALESRPHVDGDGRHWIVAYESQAVQGATPAIGCVWVTFDARTDDAYVGSERLVTTASTPHSGPHVSFNLFAAQVAYSQVRTGFSYSDAYVASLDHFSCQPCEGTFPLDATPGLTATGVAADSRGDRSLWVWQSRPASGGNGEIRGQVFKDDSGIFGTHPSTACGPPVATFATCLRGGHPAFHVRMEHADPNAPVVLIVGDRTHASTMCGTCAILDPFRSLVFPVGVTDGRGSLAVSMPVPSVPFGQPSLQFVYPPTSGPPACHWGVNFSTTCTLNAFL